MTKQSDPRIGLILLGAFVLGAVVGFALFCCLPGAARSAWSSRSSSACCSARWPR